MREDIFMTTASFASRQNQPLPAQWKQLFTAVLSDALDSAGLRDQIMAPRIRPLDDNLKLCGRARTGMYMETAYVAENENPYELEIALVDDLKPGDVAVFACGGSSRIAPWGSLLSTATRARGAAGCITDGFVRDVREIREMQLPVFCGGIAPLDSKGRGQIREIDVPVVCGGVRVAPGDLVFGDVDGIAVVPQAVEAEVLKLAFDKINGEHNTMRELKAGAYLRDVFAKYGVL
jgi:4-hydroxy-4-methyl-2-oxoglutarate aldolase